MIRTMKAAFGLGLLAALSFAAMSVMSATAQTGGHFTAEVGAGQFAILDVNEATGTPHAVALEGWGTAVECHKVKYTQATAVNPETPTVPQTTTEIKITPDYENCTAGGNPATVTMHGCHYVLTPNNIGTHATVHFQCPAGAKATVVTNNGTMKFPPQTASGVTYTTATGPTGKHSLTVDITATGLTGECHGLCQFLGTHRSDVKITGSLTVDGTDKANPGTYVGITHT